MQIAQCQEWDPERKEDIEPWHDPAFIAMIEAQAEAAENEIGMLLDIDF